MALKDKFKALADPKSQLIFKKKQTVTVFGVDNALFQYMEYKDAYFKHRFITSLN
jgi:hypothetical protein